MGRKLALIIGNSRYEDTGLSRLPTADVDVRELAAVLRAPEIGAFDEIVELPDKGLAVVRRSIAQFFSQAKKDDLLVFYFSGHGVKDENGHLYLAVRDTELKLLSGTSIEAAFITAQMDRSVSKRQILIFDCCHSGAFSQGAKASATQVVGTGPAFEGTGYGHIVLTATDSTQYAWEGDQIIGESDKSVFTHYILQGLRTGEADLDGDGKVTVDELYEYMYELVVRETPKQTPGKWSYKQQGDIVVARNPNPLVRPTILPLELQAMVESPIPRMRAEAVPELEALLRSRHPGLEAAARKALEQLRADDSRKVSAAAQEALTAPRREAVNEPARPAQNREEPKTRIPLPATLYMPRQPEPEPIAFDDRGPSRQRQPVSFPPSMSIRLALVAGIIVIALAAAFLWRSRSPQTKSADITLPPSSQTSPSGGVTTPAPPSAVPPAEAAPGATGKPEPTAPKPTGLAKPQPGSTAASGATVQAPSNNEAQISRLLSTGDDLLKAGKYADAIAAYEEAARLGNAEAFGRAAKARQEQAAQVRQRLSRVGQLMDTGGYADALTQIDEALARDSKNPDAVSLRQKALDAQNFERTSKLSADNPFTLRNVEGALRALTPSRLAALIKDFGTTFILDPSDERRFRTTAATAKIDASQLDDIVRLLAPPRDRAAGGEWTAPTDHRQMVWIPGGTFQMGSPGNETGREPDEPSHVVAIANGFWMESTEVTYAAFRKFLLENPEWQKARIDRRLHDGNYLSDWKGNVFPPGRADQPVVHVSWYAAQAYAKWAGKRLPTEAEWEYACRATRRSAYWWGDSFDAAPASATAFASAKNPWGLAAMLGGVWEWTASLYRNYPFADDGRNDPAAQGPRVIRGGAGASGPNILRSANRNRDEPERCSDLLGFRCIL